LAEFGRSAEGFDVSPLKLALPGLAAYLAAFARFKFTTKGPASDRRLAWRDAN